MASFIIIQTLGLYCPFEAQPDLSHVSVSLSVPSGSPEGVSVTIAVMK